MWMPMFTNEDDHYEYERERFDRLYGIWGEDDDDTGSEEDTDSGFIYD